MTTSSTVPHPEQRIRRKSAFGRRRVLAWAVAATGVLGLAGIGVHHLAHPVPLAMPAATTSPAPVPGDPDHRLAIDRAVSLMDGAIPAAGATQAGTGPMGDHGGPAERAGAGTGLPAHPVTNRPQSDLEQLRQFATDNAHPALDDLPPLSTADRASLQGSAAHELRPPPQRRDREPARIPDRIEGEAPLAGANVLDKAAISAQWRQP